MSILLIITNYTFLGTLEIDFFLLFENQVQHSDLFIETQ